MPLRVYACYVQITMQGRVGNGRVVSVIINAPSSANPHPDLKCHRAWRAYVAGLPVHLEAPAWLSDAQRSWLDVATVPVRSLRIAEEADPAVEVTPEGVRAGLLRVPAVSPPGLPVCQLIDRSYDGHESARSQVRKLAAATLRV